MTQPIGYINKDTPSHVCKLHKAIYDLKQAPRAWYQELSKFLINFGFTNLVSDASLFIYSKDSVILHFLIYVDDLLVIGNHIATLNLLLKQLAMRFSLKDLGTLNFFLGVEIIPTSSGMFLSQHKYIRDILEKFDMLSAKEVQTPMATTNVKLHLKDGTGPFDTTKYRQVIGSLQYISLTRPDITYSINKLSQFMIASTKCHYSCLKRILRYLKATLHHGLFLRTSSTLKLSAFTDSDWAGDPDDRTSTSAYVIYLGGNPVS